jgi:acyl-CoA reductase-like NAD-dependent aldehyde dehydrogenase
MLQDPDLVSIQEVRGKVERAWSAWTVFRTFSQEKVDTIVESAAAAARGHAKRLAELAVEETGYGNVADKYAKNMLAAEVLPRRMRGMQTRGVLREQDGVVEIAEPVGVVAAILPTTNPTSTAIYKTLIALKSGNAIVLSPHPRARRCSCETAAMLASAAEQAGAPPSTVECIGAATIEGTNELMRHHRTAVILSTGGSGIVRAAYSSGKPAFGVGPGNVPVFVDVSADIPGAVARIVEGKSFDYGTLCSSEQTLVAEKSLRDPILAALKANQAFLCDAAQTASLERTLIGRNFGIKPECVGQSAAKIAKMAGFEVPASTSILAAEIHGIGREHPLSAEKLSPVLSVYFVDNFAAALDACEAVLRFGGLGHTCGIYARDDARIREYAARMPAYRVIANTATPTGSTGLTTQLFPAMTLGCGAIAGNSTSDNVSPRHLINIKRLAYGSEMRKEHTVDRATIVAAVEKYLANRGVKPATPAITAPAIPPPEPPASTTTRPAPVEFVCEDDVKRAIRESRKIFIGPKTIVTPSARDAAGADDVLVMVKE